MGWYELMLDTDMDVSYAHLRAGVLFGRQWEAIKQKGDKIRALLFRKMNLAVTCM